LGVKARSERDEGTSKSKEKEGTQKQDVATKDEHGIRSAPFVGKTLSGKREPGGWGHKQREPDSLNKGLRVRPTKMGEAKGDGTRCTRVIAATGHGNVKQGKGNTNAEKNRKKSRKRERLKRAATRRQGEVVHRKERQREKPGGGRA